MEKGNRASANMQMHVNKLGIRVWSTQLLTDCKTPEDWKFQSKELEPV